MSGLDGIEVLRAEEEWQRAGAYSVRIQGMNREFHISLREEFDRHDGADARYIVLLESGYPIATCRFYETEQKRMQIGRVVVLPEYRGKKLGTRVIYEAEGWIRELGYTEIEVESRTEAVGFYKKLGYRVLSDAVLDRGVFDCILMGKTL